MAGNLKTQLVEDMKTAMKAHDSVSLGVIRFLLSLIKNVEIDHGEQQDAGVVTIVQTEIKKTKEALVEFQKGGRQDIVDQELAKIQVMEKYLPTQLSDEELMAKIKTIRESSGEAHPGKLTGLVMAQVRGQAEGNRVSALIKQVLN